MQSQVSSEKFSSTTSVIHYLLSLPNSRDGLLAMIPACGFSDLYDCWSLVNETGSTLLASKFRYFDTYEAYRAQTRLWSSEPGTKATNTCQQPSTLYRKREPRLKISKQMRFRVCATIQVFCASRNGKPVRQRSNRTIFGLQVSSARMGAHITIISGCLAEAHHTE